MLVAVPYSASFLIQVKIDDARLSNYKFSVPFIKIITESHKDHGKIVLNSDL